MANFRTSIVDTLLEGKSGEIYVPEDGDLASMRGILKHGQVLTLAPVTDFGVVQAAFQKLAERAQVDEPTTRRLFSVLEDLQWYAGRIGEQRWSDYPRQNKYSFRWHLWHITMQAEELTGSPATGSILALIDHSKWHTGYVAELLALFEQEDWLND
jgi:hypothetical protein